MLRDFCPTLYIRTGEWYGFGWDVYFRCQYLYVLWNGLILAQMHLYWFKFKEFWAGLTTLLPLLVSACKTNSWNSSVSVVTKLNAQGMAVRYPTGAKTFRRLQRQPSIPFNGNRELVSWWKIGRSVKLIPHCQLMPGLRMSGGTPPFSHTPTFLLYK